MAISKNYASSERSSSPPANSRSAALALAQNETSPSPRSPQTPVRGRKSKKRQANKRMRGLSDLEAQSLDSPRLQLEDVGPEDDVGNFDAGPVNQEALPLHMQSAAIADGDADSEVPMSEVEPQGSVVRSETSRKSSDRSPDSSSKSPRRSQTQAWMPRGSYIRRINVGSEAASEAQEENIPKVVLYAHSIWSAICYVLVWSSLAAALLALYACQYYFFAVGRSQEFLVHAALDQVEAAFMAVVQPARQVMRSLSTAVQMGLLKTTKDHSILGQLLLSEFWAASALLEVTLSSSIEENSVTLIQPGRVHETTANIGDRTLLIRNFTEAEALKRFGVQELQLPPPSNVGFWQGPRYVSTDESEQLPYPAMWRLAYELLWTLEGQAPNQGTLNFRAAVDLDPAQKALHSIKEAASEGSAMYICTVQGILIAGSDWEPTAALDGGTGELKYGRLWDLPASWVKELPPEALAAGGGAELLTGPSMSERVLVVVRPFTWGAQTGSNRNDLRAIAAIPRAGGLLESMTPATLAFGALVWISWLLLVLGLQIYRRRRDMQRQERALTQVQSFHAEFEDRSYPGGGGRRSGFRAPSGTEYSASVRSYSTSVRPK
eukprot:gnl/MRDRNA2_/MRDRNA2_73343_c0_seq1.p1 gnl/MRDRNA2_/MRDRNA2_73343_c0~~gnl/MRDRNA2_/MRDRNA2_73343_c0_seq1.p1  ORF type:complete len:606 (-),score=110.32 gnl/MRDRNA2_/MRDRNA2_73343_c0_seq1:154-1971(-)